MTAIGHPKDPHDHSGKAEDAMIPWPWWKWVAILAAVLWPVPIVLVVMFR